MRWFQCIAKTGLFGIVLVNDKFVPNCSTFDLLYMLEMEKMKTQKSVLKDKKAPAPAIFENGFDSNGRQSSWYIVTNREQWSLLSGTQHVGENTLTEVKLKKKLAIYSHPIYDCRRRSAIRHYVRMRRRPMMGLDFDNNCIRFFSD